MSNRDDVLEALGEVFRHYGYEGASIARISAATGLGKGSLYHLFPGGKDEMATAVIAHIHDWFERAIFSPLRLTGDTDGMWDHVAAYFNRGGRVCLIGAFALADTRDRFATAITRYFTCWIDALALAYRQGGVENAHPMAVNAVLRVQGAIVLSQALGNTQPFETTIADLRLH